MTEPRARDALTTAHGAFDTPAFMPVGTYGTVKAMTPTQLTDLGAQIVLANTFHLLMRPGDQIVRNLGGLHGFMSWSGPILTDSGGFQVWSLGALRKISEEGVDFKSPVNGDRVFLSPERSMEVQRNLGADIVMAFDECTAHPATHVEARASMELSSRWAARSKAAHADSDSRVVRHRARRDVLRSASRVARAPHRSRFRRIRGGRSFGR